MAAIDMGGGSIQEAFALAEADATKAPKDYLVTLKGGGQTFNVYVHSYLSYGLMAGRAKLLDAGGQAAVDAGHVCFPDGAAGKYTYAGKEYAYKASKDAAFEACAALGLNALNATKSCGFPQVRRPAGMAHPLCRRLLGLGKCVGGCSGARQPTCGVLGGCADARKRPWRGAACMHVCVMGGTAHPAASMARPTRHTGAEAGLGAPRT